MDTQTASPTQTRADLFVARLPTPIGTLVIVTDPTHLRAISFSDREPRLRAALARSVGDSMLREGAGPLDARGRLERYFAGDLGAIDEIPVAMSGSPFERSVWDALRTIPVGTTTTYGALAVALGHGVAASRAVGLANGSNPIPIVVPCHRVIGANGNLTGYGGGMDRKKWLLHHEGILLVGR